MFLGSSNLVFCIEYERRGEYQQGEFRDGKTDQKEQDQEKKLFLYSFFGRIFLPLFFAKSVSHVLVLQRGSECVENCSHILTPATKEREPPTDPHTN